MMERYVGAKPNIFYFQTDKGVFVIGTDDPVTVAEAEWFREFLGLRRAAAMKMREVEELPELPELPPAPRPKPVQQAPVQKAVFDNEIFEEKPMPVPKPPVKMIDPMEITPDQMVEQLWTAMDASQRVAWRKKWLGQ